MAVIKLVSIMGHEVSRSSIRTSKPKAWINSQVLNAFSSMETLTARCSEIVKAEEIWYLPTWFQVVK